MSLLILDLHDMQISTSVFERLKAALQAASRREKIQMTIGR